MADDKQFTSKREQHIARLKSKYPDRNFEDDEELFGAISDDYDQYDQKIGEYEGREKALSNMFAADPRSAQFLTDMHNGQDPILGLVRNFGLEIKDYLDDPEMQDKLAEANKDYIERVAKGRQMEEEYNANEEETKETLRSFQEENGLTDEQLDAIFAKALEIVTDGVKFRYTRETLEMVRKAMNYDADVAMAAEEGEIAGRNAKIEEKLRKSQQGDGTNPIGGSHNSGAPKRARSIFDLANEAL